MNHHKKKDLCLKIVFATLHANFLAENVHAF